MNQDKLIRRARALEEKLGRPDSHRVLESLYYEMDDWSGETRDNFFHAFSLFLKNSGTQLHWEYLNNAMRRFQHNLKERKGVE